MSTVEADVAMSLLTPHSSMAAQVVHVEALDAYRTRAD
jgi:hypothetical protein